MSLIEKIVKIVLIIILILLAGFFVYSPFMGIGLVMGFGLPFLVILVLFFWSKREGEKVAQGNGNSVLRNVLQTILLICAIGLVVWMVLSSIEISYMFTKGI